MWYIIAASIITLGILLSFNFKAVNKTENEININCKEQKTILMDPSDTIKPVYSKKDIKAKLKKLSKTPPPDDLAFGAMCYEMVGPPNKASYICPVCGAKTLHKIKEDHTNYEKMNLIHRGITACRNEIKTVKGINISLDESQFCKKCSPETDEAQLCLLVNINDVKDTVKVCKIDHLDIRLIKEFLNDEFKHKGSNDGESPLVNHIDRIQELLGIQLK